MPKRTAIRELANQKRRDGQEKAMAIRMNQGADVLKGCMVYNTRHL